MNSHSETCSNILRRITDIYFETNLSGEIELLSPSVERITGFTVDELEGKNLNILYRNSDYNNLFYNRLMKENSVSNIELILTDKQGRLRYTLISADLFHEHGKNGISGLIKDINSRKEEENELYKFATYDELTGTYNRRVGMEFLKQELKKLKREKSWLSICFIDIDNLKEVNDNFGHECGDMLIKAIVTDIKSAMRESDILCRLGGDEFLLIFPSCRITEVQDIWNRVQKAIDLRNKTGKQKFNISASYGFAETNSDELLSFDDIMQIADKKMYEQKRKNRNSRRFRK